MNSKIIREGAQITIEITNIEEISEVMLGEIIHNIIITKEEQKDFTAKHFRDEE